jgi:hypothetical protein
MPKIKAQFSKCNSTKSRHYSRRTQNRLARIEAKHLALSTSKPITAYVETTKRDRAGQFYNDDKGSPQFVKYKASQSKPLPLYDSNRLTRSKNEVVKQLSRKLNDTLK